MGRGTGSPIRWRVYLGANGLWMVRLFTRDIKTGDLFPDSRVTAFGPGRIGWFLAMDEVKRQIWAARQMLKNFHG